MLCPNKLYYNPTAMRAVIYNFFNQPTCATTTANIQLREFEIENACGWKCRQAVQTRLCGGIPADLTFWVLFWSSKKVQEENMNGRLYDPVIGRFFSPDKYVANSSFTQDFNRYTYCLNNPLKYVVSAVASNKTFV